MLLEKIDIVEKRYDEIYKLIGNPEIIADQKKYIELNKELKELGKLVNKGRLYKDFIHLFRSCFRFTHNKFKDWGYFK